MIVTEIVSIMQKGLLLKNIPGKYTSNVHGVYEENTWREIGLRF